MSTSEDYLEGKGTAENAVAAEGEQTLKKNALGVWEIAFFVIAASAPVFVASVAFTAYMLGGIGAPLAYLVAGFFLLFFAFAFTAMAKYIRNAGAFYAYITQGLGRIIGAGCALAALFGYGVACIAVIGAFAYFCQMTCQDLLGVNIPWQVLLLLEVAGIAIIGHRSINLAANLLLVFLSAEIIILFVLSIAVLIQNPGYISLEPFSPGNLFVPGVAGLLVMGFGAFYGFESTAIYSEEARNPEKTIPRATYIAVGFLAIFYAFVVWIASVAFGVDGVVKMAVGPEGSNMYFNMSNQFLGYWAEVTMRILIVTSIAACLIGFWNATARYSFALGRNRVLPHILGRAHPKHHSPYIASAVQAVIIAVIAIVAMLLKADPYLHLFVWPYAAAITAVVFVQCVTAIAILRYFWNDRRGFSIFRVVVSPIIGGVGLAVSFYLILTNFWVLSGYTEIGKNLPFILAVPVVFIIGAVIAYRMKQKRPQEYKLLGANAPE